MTNQTLTDREKEILKLIVSGRTNAEIASKLQIKEGTVATHRTSIRIKLKVTNTADLIHYSKENNLL